MKKLLFSALILIFSINALADVTVYSDRPSELTNPISAAFEASSGHKVIVKAMDKYKVIKKALTSGDTQADVIFVKDMAYLNDLSNNSYLQTLDAGTLGLAPSFAQGAQADYVAVSLRARTIVYDPNEISAADLSTYEDLADPKWIGSLCLRTSKSSYNEALVSSLIAQHGEEKTKKIVQGWVNNFAKPPFPNDRAVLDAIVGGDCILGLVNSYYLAGKIDINPAYPVKIFFANQGAGGTHVNGMGVGVTSFSKNSTAAQEFVTFLLSVEIQTLISTNSNQYPARIGMVAPVKTLIGWGDYTASVVNWSSLADYSDTAKSLMTEVGYK